MARRTLKDDPFPIGGGTQNLQRWFHGRIGVSTDERIRLLLARGALRGLPQLRDVPNKAPPGQTGETPDQLLSALRCYPLALSVPVARYANHINHFRRNAADAGIGVREQLTAIHLAARTASELVRGAAQLSLVQMSAALDPDIVKVIQPIALDANASDKLAPYLGAAFEQDCRLLDSIGLTALACHRLWPDWDEEVAEAFLPLMPADHGFDPSPKAFREELARFIPRLRDLPGDFLVWVEWYDGIVRGSRNGRYLFGLPTGDMFDPAVGPAEGTALRLNLDIAMIDNALWKGDPAELHAEIRRLVEVARGEAKEEAGEEDIPTIPAPKPSALEAVWEDGRLVLPAAPVVADSSPENAEAALKALKADFSELALDAEDDANIDKRAIAYLRRLGERIPDAAPSNFELHRIAQNETALQNYGRTVSDEWPKIYAVRYHALSLQFKRTMGQFPAWREFKIVAANGELSKVQVEAAPHAATEFAKALREPELANIVDEAIPAALEELAEMADSAAQNPIELGKDLIVADLLAAIETIAIRIAEAALAFKQGTSRIAGKAWDEFAKNAEKSIIEQAGKTGKAVGPLLAKWLSRLVKYGLPTGSAYVGGTAFLIWLAETFPKWFSWLIPIVKVLT